MPLGWYRRVTNWDGADESAECAGSADDINQGEDGGFGASGDVAELLHGKCISAVGPLRQAESLGVRFKAPVVEGRLGRRSLPACGVHRTPRRQWAIGTVAKHFMTGLEQRKLSALIDGSRPETGRAERQDRSPSQTEDAAGRRRPDRHS